MNAIHSTFVVAPETEDAGIERYAEFGCSDDGIWASVDYSPPDMLTAASARVDVILILPTAEQETLRVKVSLGEGETELCDLDLTALVTEYLFKKGE